MYNIKNNIFHLLFSRLGKCAIGKIKLLPLIFDILYPYLTPLYELSLLASHVSITPIKLTFSRVSCHFVSQILVMLIPISGYYPPFL